jgi:hypothetical protein
MNTIASQALAKAFKGQLSQDGYELAVSLGYKKDRWF